MYFFILYAFILFCLPPMLFAAPTTSDISPLHTLSGSLTASAPTLPRTADLQITTITRSLHVLQSDTVTYVSHSHRPAPTTHTRSAQSIALPTSTPVHRLRQPPVTIVFEVVGGLAGLALVFSFMRCLYSYKKTPGRDRIAALIHRHQLQREMEELQQNSRFLQRSSLHRPAPPPYFPPPPSYVEADRASIATPRVVVSSLPASLMAPTAFRNG